MATPKKSSTSKSTTKTASVTRTSISSSPSITPTSLETKQGGNMKKIIVGLGAGVLLLGGLYFVKDKFFGSDVNDDIKRYEARAERYPDDPENYKTLAALYEKSGKKDLAEKAYDLYQRALHASLNRDDSKRQQELQALRDAIMKKNDSSSSRQSESSLAESKDKSSQASKQEKADKDANAALKACIDLYNSGLKLYDEGKYGDALKKFEEAIKLKPDYAKAYSKIARIDYVQSDFKGAMSSAEKALQNDSRDEEGHFVEADVYRETKDFAKADEHYRKVLESNPQNALAYFRLGGLRFREKKFSEASELFQKSYNLDSDYYKTSLNLGITRFRMGDNAGAKRNIELALKIPSMAKDNQSLYTAYSQLGKIYDASGDKQRALDSLIKATTYSKSPADACQIASIYEDLGNTTKAKEYYLSAIALKDDFFEARFNLGLIYYNEKKYKEAYAQYSAAMAANGNFIPAIIQAGKCQAELGNAEEGKSLFDKAIKIDPNHPTANLELARYWKNKGSSKEAISFAQASLASAKANDEKLVAYNELGLIYLKWKMYDEGEKAFVGARGLQPSNTEILNNLLKLYLDKDDFEKAAEIDETLIKVNKNDFETYEKLGNLYIKLGKKSEAKATLSKLLELNPNYPNKSKVDNLLKSL